MKYSIKQFANEIRQKNPNSYDDLSDQKLVELWVKKHPDDKDKIRNEKIDLINLEFYLFLVAIFIPIFLLTKPNLLYDFTPSEGILVGYTEHNLKTGSYITIILLSLGFLFLIYHNFSLRQFKWILIFIFNLGYIGALLFLQPLSPDYFRALNPNGDFHLNSESIFYGVLLICCNIFYLLKIRYFKNRF
jgi:hypothetical protein